MKKQAKKASGAQSLQRGLQILRLVGAHHIEGLRLSDVISHLGLERSTGHRLLSCLCEEQFVEKNPDTKRYHLGIMAMQIGYETTQRLPLVENYRPVMKRLARTFGDTVFLLARQGDYAVCLHVEEGPFPVKITTTVAGAARPLGIGSGGTAIMAALDDHEIEQIFTRQAGAYEAMRLSLSKLNKSISNTRKYGYTETIDAVSRGISGVGALIPISDEPFAAISVGGITTRMNAEKRKKIGQRLLKELYGD